MQNASLTGPLVVVLAVDLAVSLTDGLAVILARHLAGVLTYSFIARFAVHLARALADKHARLLTVLAVLAVNLASGLAALLAGGHTFIFANVLTAYFALGLAILAGFLAGFLAGVLTGILAGRIVATRVVLGPQGPGGEGADQGGNRPEEPAAGRRSVLARPVKCVFTFL